MSAENTFSPFTTGLASPVRNIALVVPHDTNELDVLTRGISFSVIGALKVVTAGGETVTIPSGSLAAGIIHPLRVKQVFDTGTTATNIVAYW